MNYRSESNGFETLLCMKLVCKFNKYLFSQSVAHKMLKQLIAWDQHTSRLIYSSLNESLGRQSASRKFLSSSLKLHTICVDGILWFPLVPLIIVMIKNSQRENDLTLAILEIYLGTVLAAVVELLIKSIVKRSRPSIANNKKPRFVKAENYSFPSGHALRAFYIAAWISTKCKTRLEFFALLLWAVLVGFSRIAAGRHFVLDVVFGGALGSALAFLVNFKNTAYSLSHFLFK
jgi:undecaprenyl-diphosphatase